MKRTCGDPEDALMQARSSLRLLSLVCGILRQSPIPALTTLLVHTSIFSQFTMLYKNIFHDHGYQDYVIPQVCFKCVFKYPSKFMSLVGNCRKLFCFGSHKAYRHTNIHEYIFTFNLKLSGINLRSKFTHFPL